MAGIEEDDEEQEKRLDGMPDDFTPEDRIKVMSRMGKNNTGIGLPDFVFRAPMLVRDSFDSLLKVSFSLQDMTDNVMNAAKSLKDDDWIRFQEIPAERIHQDDQITHGQLFAQVELTWRAFIQKPKKSKTTCVFLFIGTDPPSPKLADFLGKLGWLGAVICQKRPWPGSEDIIDHVKIDVADKKDQRLVDELVEHGGLCPKPKYFQFAYVNVLYNRTEDAHYVDSDEEQETKDASISKKPSYLEEMPLPHQVPETLKGYGKIGITRGGSVRRRLRALRNSLKVALSRLVDDGTLVVCWPGLPLHPLLFWLTFSLRNIFQRVHICAGDGAKSFECYILAAGFKKSKAEATTPGMGGLELHSFLHSTYREDSLDDVIYWTLRAQEEIDEAGVGSGGRGIVHGYDGLWSRYGEKYRCLVAEMGLTSLLPFVVKPTGTAKAPKEGKKSKGAAKAKAKAKARATSDEDKDADEKEKPQEAAAEAPVELSAAPSSGDKAEVKAGPPSKPSASETPAAPSTEQATEAPAAEPPTLATGQPPDTASPSDPPDADKQEHVNEEVREATKDPTSILADVEHAPPKKKPFKLKRAVPQNACTLGAAPGNKHLQPDYEEMASTWKLVSVALAVAKRGRAFTRRNKSGNKDTKVTSNEPGSNGPKTAWT
eukprot:TRINITY_DN25429_c0_g1_i1.p1 TRINITY_DN25429_c0_g1~~TRINITY_DN25429_c0_g1_i1.p1  ORF type:complete len:656 (-),score=122.46 TRINITY_DN25429_c0_g1_i1:58-2025(-)